MAKITAVASLVPDADYTLQGFVFDQSVLASNSNTFTYRGVDEDLTKADDDGSQWLAFSGKTDGTMQYIVVSGGELNYDPEVSAIDSVE